MTRQELTQQIYKKQSFLCVGLDSDPRLMPKCPIFDMHDPIYEFNRMIIDATAPYCVAYKPNLAFYEAYGVKGMVSFEKTINYLKENYPDHFIIADAKRGDIGNTSAMYARTFFQEYNIDAVTVAPYMGNDSVTPFLEYKGKWVILLALTSNKGSQDFQLARLSSPEGDTSGDALECRSGQHTSLRLFERVILKSQEWGNEENMMYVVGATQGRMFEDIRRIAPKHFLLVPGVGAQGGSLEEVCRYGMIPGECGLLVNSSRGIIYASDGPDFAEAAANKARELQQQMAALLR